jgi:hypothetical protein
VAPHLSARWHDPEIEVPISDLHRSVPGCAQHWAASASALSAGPKGAFAALGRRGAEGPEQRQAQVAGLSARFVACVCCRKHLLCCGRSPGHSKRESAAVGGSPAAAAGAAVPPAAPRAWCGSSPPSRSACRAARPRQRSLRLRCRATPQPAHAASMLRFSAQGAPALHRYTSLLVAAMVAPELAHAIPATTRGVVERSEGGGGREGRRRDPPRSGGAGRALCEPPAAHASLRMRPTSPGPRARWLVAG